MCTTIDRRQNTFPEKVLRTSRRGSWDIIISENERSTTGEESGVTVYLARLQELYRDTAALPDVSNIRMFWTSQFPDKIPQ